MKVGVKKMKIPVFNMNNSENEFESDVFDECNELSIAATKNFNKNRQDLILLGHSLEEYMSFKILKLFKLWSIT